MLSLTPIDNNGNWWVTDGAGPVSHRVRWWYGAYLCTCNNSQRPCRHEQAVLTLVGPADPRPVETQATEQARHMGHIANILARGIYGNGRVGRVPDVRRRGRDLEQPAWLSGRLPYLQGGGYNNPGFRYHPSRRRCGH